jgi:hypothetical protein
MDLTLAKKPLKDCPLYKKNQPDLSTVHGDRVKRLLVLLWVP